MQKICSLTTIGSTLISILSINAATVTFNSGTFGTRGEGGLTVFETSTGALAENATLQAGRFTIDPGTGPLEFDFVQSNFEAFAALGSGDSSDQGFFTDSSFIRPGDFTNDNPEFANERLYLLALSEDQSEFAVISDPSWTFGSDSSASSIGLGEIKDSDDFLAGSLDEATTSFATVDSIQLAPVPEPSSALLGLLGLGLLARRRR